MKKIATFALATLMLTGILTAATSSPVRIQKSATLQDGGPVPLCDPYANPNCKIK